MHEKDSLLINAVIKANVAYAVVVALQKTLLETEELKPVFKKHYSIQLQKLIDDLEAIFGVDSMKDILSTLKERGIL